MPLKKYGIFLAYPPTVDLRAEGLGRYLAEFLKAAQGRKDVGFVIACPSWTVDILRELCLEVGVQIEKIEFVSPRHKPVLLRMYECYRWFRQRRGSLSVYTRLLSKLKRVQHLFYDYLIGKLVSIRHWMIFMLFGVPLLPFVFLIIMFSSVRILWRVIFLLVRKILQHFLKGEKVRKQRERLMRALSQPKLDSSVVRMYHYMAEGETSLLLGLIAKRKDILAWYCPAAFWPQFNEIASPRLMCVPDVVLGDFPVGFAAIGGERFLNNFRQVEKAIKGGKYYITYSQYVKWQTLVRRYHIKPDDVFVVPHGVNRLDEVINISIFDTNSDSATRKLCHDFFRTALLKSVKREYANFIVNSSEINYLFYASQFRPNKNVVNLLRDYNYLLKHLYIKQKIILNGN
ncbi:MAG: hypothetical protein ACUVTU_05430, partial [Desulfurispora sp.]|uniref:hypothetical protein n=1 Tax=Desulfurispora sp. TaxID=3014275 RepID=UPI00404A64E5